MIQRIFEADDLILSVEVTFDANAEIQSLTGGTVIARAWDQTSPVVVATSATIVDANTIKVVFSDGTLSAGSYRLQVRATVANVTQTLVDLRLEVLPSV